MKKFSRLTRLIIVSLLLSSSFPCIYSQETMKFGKIDPADLNLKTCPFDSSADAMVLGDVGQTYYVYDDHEGFVMMFERHTRIKIFTKNGYSEANIEIPFYHSDQDREKIIALKAKTYNLEGGKIIEKKVEDESIFEEDLDAHWKNSKIIFPGIKEGSVIELKYTIRSPFLDNLRDWYFQGHLPVRWSEYEISIPEYFHYSKQTSGFFPFAISKTSTITKHITQTVMNRGGDQYNVTHTVSTSSLDYTDNITHLATKNVPAFKEEPYTSSVMNYVSKIEFEYNGYQLPNGPVITVNSTWEEIVDNLEKDNDFGQQIKKGGLVKEIVDEINGRAKEPFDKMLLAYEYIKMNFKWNDYNSKYPTSTLRKAFQSKTGNSADINLSLVLLLRELDLPANPVILSTRENGIVLPLRPTISKMNYVIALVSIDGKEYLLDATSRLRPYNMLPFQCLNGEGLVVSKDAMRWVPLVREEKEGSLFYAEMKILQDGEIKGKLDVSKSGFQAVRERSTFLREGEVNYRKLLKENLRNWSFDSISWKNMENIKESLTNTYYLSSRDVIQSTGNMIYLNVLLNMGQNTNPFHQQNREYPVDFGCPVRDTYIFTYEIPEGYVVESIPETINVVLPEQAGSFRFIAAVQNNKISISSKLVLNKSFFFQTEYNDLKELFNKISTKHAQQIVLKKA